MTTITIFTERDIQFFRQWLCLDMKSVTWQGKYTEEFEKFWDIFFKPDINLSEFSKRFSYAIERSTVGPISSWFVWLRNKFICYTFIEKGISVRQLCEEFEISPGVIGKTLRDFFADAFPHHEDYINDAFLITNSISDNYDLTVDKVIHDLQETINFSGSHDQEIMKALEVTLYDDWSLFLDRMYRDFVGKTLDLSSVESKDSFKKKMQVFANLIAIIGATIFIVLLVEFANKKYEKYLSEKISIYEPQFLWINQGLKFTEKDDQKTELANFELDIQDIENVDDTENFLGEALEDEERFGAESEVVLTSWDSLPKDFDVADSEQSSYEEGTRRGYRDTRYGNTKVYRVMMRSSDTNSTRGKLTKLLSQYNVKQVDNVKPGLAVPGGFYYNLYVPRTYLKEFMAQVQDVDTAVIYESRTRTRRNPPGQNKVFIWVKSI